MSKHYVKRDRVFEVEFRESDKATAHGGQFGVSGLANKFGLWERVRKARALDPRKQSGKGYDPELYVSAFLFSFTSGGDSIADAGRVDDDVCLKTMFGAKKTPDQAALGEWLRTVGESKGADALRRINRDFVAWCLKRADPARLLHQGQLECFFDDTQLEVTGHCFEGAGLNYNNDIALSWQTLWLGPFLVDGILGTPSDQKEEISSETSGGSVSAWLPSMLKRNKHLWKNHQTYFYADSASSAGTYLECAEEHFDQFSISYNKWVGPLERKAAELPEATWSQPEQIKWRDGKIHLAQYNWFRYRPGGCERNKRYAVVRHKRMDGDMFWSYHFVVCDENRGGQSAQAAFQRHRLKGEYERLFGEILRDMGMHHPPCKSLAANNVYYQLAMLAFNMLQTMKLLYLPSEHQPKRIKTIIHHLLLIPVELKRHARQIKAVCFVSASWIEWWRGLLQELLPRYRLLGGT